MNFDNLFFSSHQRSVCCGQKMPKKEHRCGICRQIHQETTQQVESTRGDKGWYRARGEHPEGDPAPKHHHSAWSLWKQGRSHPDPGTVSSLFYFYAHHTQIIISTQKKKDKKKQSAK